MHSRINYITPALLLCWNNIFSIKSILSCYFVRKIINKAALIKLTDVRKPYFTNQKLAICDSTNIFFSRINSFSDSSSSIKTMIAREIKSIIIDILIIPKEKWINSLIITIEPNKVKSQTCKYYISLTKLTR